MSLYVATYDISDDRRRTRVARLLMQYGTRVQKSVFEIYLDPEELRPFRCELGGMLSERDDFALIPIDERGTRSTVTWQRAFARFDSVIMA